MRFGQYLKIKPHHPSTRTLLLIAGPLIAFLMIEFLHLDPANPNVTMMAAVAVWMALWWMTEVVPLAATALIPAVMFPFLEIMPENKVAPMYFNSTILLFLGGMMIALAMERWNLHKRFALVVIRFVGLSPARLMLGFVVATAFLSAWISNTATAMMMLPIAMAVVKKLEEEGEDSARGLNKFTIGLLLSIAFAASIGGFATLVGTPPNLAFAEIFKISFPHAPEISFARWLLFAMPLSLVMLVLAWLFLAHRYCRHMDSSPTKTGVFMQQLKELGPMSIQEKSVMAVFLMTAVLWMTRSTINLGSFTFNGWGSLFQLTDAAGKVTSFVNDGTVAITMALLLFVIPTPDKVNGKRVMLMQAPDLKPLPIGIILLFGGGFALAGGFKASGLSAWCGDQLTGLAGLPPVLLVAAICLVMVAVTNLTSNTATTQMVLPILVTMGVAVNVNPLLLMVPATLAASCAFMLPAATPPNAIVFGSERLSVKDMATAGMGLNLIAVVLVVVAIFTVGNLVLGIDPAVMPEWALKH